MGFKENLLKKIQIDELVKSARETIRPTESGRRVDKDIMARLLELGGYSSIKERDLTLYILDGDKNNGRFLVLDNDLAIYQTSVADIGLRKSPTVKEMISLRNIKKILVDTDVVLSRKEASLNTIRKACIDQLDLNFDVSDIEAIVQEGQFALERGDHDQVRESLSLFSELLSYAPAPPPFQTKGHEIMGNLAKAEDGEIRFGPLVLYDPDRNILKYIDSPIGSFDKEKMENFKKVLRNEADASVEGAGVFDKLKTEIFG